MDTPVGIEEKIVPSMLPQWKEFVEETISMPISEQRNYALAVLAQVSKLVIALGQGMGPAEAIMLVDPDTTLIQIGAIVQDVVMFSLRGEEFRLWWNEWHDRVHPGDRKPGTDQKRPRLIFNPSQISFKGKPMVLAGRFDPAEPLTKKAAYADLVARAIEAAKGKPA